MQHQQKPEDSAWRAAARWFAVAAATALSLWCLQDLRTYAAIGPAVVPFDALINFRSIQVASAVVALVGARALWRTGAQDPSDLLVVLTVFLAGCAIGNLAADGRGPFVPIAAGLAVLSWGAVHLVRLREPTRSSIDPDAPVASLAEDLFERAGIVSKCVSLLVSDAVKCPRIALVAPVGHGKTSVAYFIREQLKAQGHEFVRFDPWLFSQEESEVLDALILSIIDTLELGGRRLGVRWGLLVRRTLTGILGEHWAAGFRQPVEGLLARSQGYLERACWRALRGKRLIVFIDDVERCSESVAHRLLVEAKEVLNTQHIAFLFAFDREALPFSDEAEKASLIDKVFDMTCYLPAAKPDAMSVLDARFCGSNDRLLTALADLGAVLPVSPRTRKRFHLRWKAWNPSIESAPDVLDARLLLALLFLEYRFEGSLDYIAGDPLCIDEIETGALQRAVHRRWASDAPVPEFPGAPWHQNGQAEFEAVCAGRVQDVPVVEYVRWLRGGEFTKLCDLSLRLNGVADTSGMALLDAMAATEGATLGERHRALCSFRTRALGVAAEAHYDQERRDHIQIARNASIARKLLVAAAHPGASLDGDDFAQAVRSFCNWCRFPGPYNVAHDAELETIEATLAAFPSAAIDFYAACAAIHPRSVSDDSGEADLALARVKSRAVEGARRYLVNVKSAAEVLGLLERDRAIFGYSHAELWTSSSIDAFRKLVDGSPNADPSLWVQTYHLWRGLCEEVERERRADGHVAALLSIVWSALTRSPLNRRKLGSLEEEEVNLRAAVPTLPEFPKPSWWTEIHSEIEQRWKPPSK